MSPSQADATVREPRSRPWSSEEFQRIVEARLLDGGSFRLRSGVIVHRSSPSPPVLWTQEQYYAMDDLGLFEGRRVELIAGGIVDLSPRSWPHTACLSRAVPALIEAFGAGHWVRSQLPLNLGPLSLPEPDVSVVRGGLEDYQDHPRAAVLVAEISLSSLAFDRTTKASLYARAAIPEYWIVNLLDDQIEVHRDPQGAGANAHYADVTHARPGEALSPLSASGARIEVSALLA